MKLISVAKVPACIFLQEQEKASKTMLQNRLEQRKIKQDTQHNNIQPPLLFDLCINYSNHQSLKKKKKTTVVTFERLHRDTK